jgi:hypothetical protein
MNKQGLVDSLSPHINVLLLTTYYEHIITTY